MGERVNKIRFIGSIKRETRVRENQYALSEFWEKKVKTDVK